MSEERDTLERFDEVWLQELGWLWVVMMLSLLRGRIDVYVIGADDGIDLLL